MIDGVQFAFLNAVYLKKMVTVDDIAAITALPLETVEDLASSFAASEEILSMPAGVLLMPAGTEAVLDYYRAEYDGLGADPALAVWYERFEVINNRFIALISEWQRSSGDPAVLDKAIQTVGRLIKAIGEIEPRIPRYEAYSRRFTRAIERVDAGDEEYVTNPTKDSIHNIWFEFHEDILAVLGRPRDTT